MRPALHSSLLLLLATTTPARGEVFNLDDAAPWVASNGAAVRWDEGWDALVVADSACVRVNARGVYAKPSHWTPRDLAAAGWTGTPCHPGGTGALCAAARGRVFPAAPGWGRPTFNASAVWAGLAGGCTREADGRVLDPSRPGYDVSACDVLDGGGGGDVVVCGRTAWTRRTGVSAWVYWVLCLLAVLVVRALSYLVVRRMQGDNKETAAVAAEAPLLANSNPLTVGACLAVLPFVLVPDGDAGFVTEEERFFFLALCGYMAAYALLFVQHARCRGAGGGDPPIYNLIAATLQVIACRLYTGVETPYNPILIWAVMTRALVKLRGGFDPVASTTALVDSLLLALMCVLGFPYHPLYLVAVACAAVTTADAFC
jgi:hypothetical protein